MSQTDLHIWQCLHSLRVQNWHNFAFCWQKDQVTVKKTTKKNTLPTKNISVKSTELTGQPYCSRLNAVVEWERPGDVYNLLV